VRISSKKMKNGKMNINLKKWLHVEEIERIFFMVIIKYAPFHGSPLPFFI